MQWNCPNFINMNLLEGFWPVSSSVGLFLGTRLVAPRNWHCHSGMSSRGLLLSKFWNNPSFKSLGLSYGQTWVRITHSEFPTILCNWLQSPVQMLVPFASITGFSSLSLPLHSLSALSSMTLRTHPRLSTGLRMSSLLTVSMAVWCLPALPG